MGYYVHTRSGDIRIPKENLDKCYQILCTLNASHDMKNGGCGAGLNEMLQNDSNLKKDFDSKKSLGVPNRWFSWMPWNYDQVCKNTKEIIQYLGFSTETDPSGNLLVTDYDNKCGQEEEFFSAIAPYVDPASELEWCGEDGEYWKWVFRNGRLDILAGWIEYEDLPEPNGC